MDDMFGFSDSKTLPAGPILSSNQDLLVFLLDIFMFSYHVETETCAKVFI